MSSFTEPVHISWDEDNPRLATVTREYIYYLEWDNSSEYIKIEAGFKTDGASTPARYDFILPRWNGKTIKAAIAHDHAYKYRTIHTAGGHTRTCTRKEADKLFYDMLRVGGLRYINRSGSLRWYRSFTWRVRCQLAYMALRALGWTAWFRHRWNER